MARLSKVVLALAALLAVAAATRCSAAANAGPGDVDQQAHGRSLTGFFLGKWLGSQQAAATPAAATPAAATPTTATASARAAAPPATVPGSGGGKFGLINDLTTALRCQKVYQARYQSNPDNLRAALGPTVRLRHSTQSSAAPTLSPY